MFLFFFSDIQSTPNFSQLSRFYCSILCPFPPMFTDDPEDTNMHRFSKKYWNTFSLSEKQLQLHHQSTAQAGWSVLHCACLSLLFHHRAVNTPQYVISSVKLPYLYVYVCTRSTWRWRQQLIYIYVPNCIWSMQLSKGFFKVKNVFTW